MIYNIMILVAYTIPCIYFLIWISRKLAKLNDNASHYKWLWDTGLKESAYLIDPKFNDRIGM